MFLLNFFARWRKQQRTITESATHVIAEGINQSGQEIQVLPESKEATYELLYKIAVERLGRQLDTVRSIDTKITTWLTVPSLVITFLATLLAVQQNSFTPVTEWLVRIGFASYFAGLIILFLAYRPRNWATGPSLEQFAQRVTKPNSKIQSVYYDYAYFVITNTIPENKDHLKNKERQLGRGVAFSLIGVALVVGAVLTSLQSRQTQPTLLPSMPPSTPSVSPVPSAKVAPVVRDLRLDNR